MNNQSERAPPDQTPAPLPTAEQLVADVSALVTPPTVCVKMFELVRSQSASAHDIGQIVALDPNLTGRLLRIVNSPYFGFAGRITTIERAVTVLGVKDLYNMVLAITAVRSFSKVGEGLVSVEKFWQHSVFCALVARELAKHYKLPDPERFFVAGLLHEVGACIIYSQLPQFVETMRATLQTGEKELYCAEAARFGYTHADVGSLVLKQWELPDEIRDAVQYHHAPSDAPDARIETALLHAADGLANHCETGALGPGQLDDLMVEHSVWQTLGGPLSEDDHKMVLDLAHAAFSTAMKNLMPGTTR